MDFSMHLHANGPPGVNWGYGYNYIMAGLGIEIEGARYLYNLYPMIGSNAGNDGGGIWRLLLVR